MTSFKLKLILILSALIPVIGLAQNVYCPSQITCTSNYCSYSGSDPGPEWYPPQFRSESQVGLNYIAAAVQYQQDQPSYCVYVNIETGYSFLISNHINYPMVPNKQQQPNNWISNHPGNGGYCGMTIATRSQCPWMY